MDTQIIKYPSTRHVEGSRHQKGDSPEDKPLAELEGKYLVQEEKIDGANSGLSFSKSGVLRLQSRGHYLTGGGRERHFSLFKTWANTHSAAFHKALGSRFIMYGEWAYAKHTCYYNALPAYFLEFDVYDTERQVFLSTSARRELLFGLPIVPVPVLKKGIFKRGDSISDQVKPTLYCDENSHEHLMEDARASGSRIDMVVSQSDLSELAEGIYIKVEEGASPLIVSNTYAVTSCRPSRTVIVTGIAVPSCRTDLPRASIYLPLIQASLAPMTIQTHSNNGTFHVRSINLHA